MDMSQLKALGEIAGIGGIALGVVVLVLRPLIAAIPGLPKRARAGPVKIIAIGCFVIGALGIVAWGIGSRGQGPQVTTRGAQSPGVVSGGDASVGYGSSPTASPGKSDGGPKPSGAVRTEGSQSPGIVTGGKATIDYAPAAPAK
jgi:hypothetical protein